MTGPGLLLALLPVLVLLPAAAAAAVAYRWGFECGLLEARARHALRVLEQRAAGHTGRGRPDAVSSRTGTKGSRVRVAPVAAAMAGRVPGRW